MLNAILQKFESLRSKPSTVTINGQTVSGRSIVARNGKIFVDGKEVDTAGALKIEIVGDIAQLQVDAGEVNITGHCQEVKTGSANVMCASVGGSVETGSGNVACTAVYADVSTHSGNIVAEEIHGAATSRSGNVISG